jgi:hypothetical protein
MRLRAALPALPFSATRIVAGAPTTVLPRNGSAPQAHEPEQLPDGYAGLEPINPE